MTWKIECTKSEKYIYFLWVPTSANKRNAVKVSEKGWWVLRAVPGESNMADKGRKDAVRPTMATTMLKQSWF